MQSVQTNYITLILLRILGFAGNVAVEEVRYNPFKSYRYDKYSQPDNESFAKIHQIENFLDTCKRYDIKE